MEEVLGHPVENYGFLLGGGGVQLWIQIVGTICVTLWSAIHVNLIHPILIWLHNFSYDLELAVQKFYGIILESGECKYWCFSIHISFIFISVDLTLYCSPFAFSPYCTSLIYWGWTKIVNWLDSIIPNTVALLTPIFFHLKRKPRREFHDWKYSAWCFNFVCFWKFPKWAGQEEIL